MKAVVVVAATAVEGADVRAEGEADVVVAEVVTSSANLSWEKLFTLSNHERKAPTR